VHREQPDLVAHVVSTVLNAAHHDQPVRLRRKDLARVSGQLRSASS
jgi:hypothetical protein